MGEQLSQLTEAGVAIGDGFKMMVTLLTTKNEELRTSALMSKLDTVALLTEKILRHEGLIKAAQDSPSARTQALVQMLNQQCDSALAEITRITSDSQ